MAVQDGPQIEEGWFWEGSWQREAEQSRAPARLDFNGNPLGMSFQAGTRQGRRPPLPASGDIRASLFHGEEQIAAFDATKPAGCLSFGARSAPSARWAAFSSTG